MITLLFFLIQTHYIPGDHIIVLPYPNSIISLLTVTPLFSFLIPTLLYPCWSHHCPSLSQLYNNPGDHIIVLFILTLLYPWLITAGIIKWISNLVQLYFSCWSKKIFFILSNGVHRGGEGAVPPKHVEGGVAPPPHRNLSYHTFKIWNWSVKKQNRKKEKTWEVCNHPIWCRFLLYQLQYSAD